jgi:nucleoside-diphosphate-sugar epimerase
LGGYIIAALLARGDRVRSFGRNDYPQLSAQGVEVVRGDIRDRDAVTAACRGVDCVFHAAAMPGISMQRRTYDEVNRLGTEHVLTACRAGSVSRLIFSGSPSSIFAGQDQNGVNERVPYDFQWMEANRAWYSLTKARAEEAVLAANGPDLRTCSVRPHLIWGPRDTHLIPRLVARARAGRLQRIGDGTNLIDVTYVENAAEAHLLAADALATEAAPAAGKAYFVSQGQPENCWQWVDEVLTQIGLPPVKRSMSLNSARRIGAVCDTVYSLLRLAGDPPMTRFLAAQLATSHWFDISAARRDLGYEPRVSTAEGMRRLGEWLRRECR